MQEFDSKQNKLILISIAICILFSIAIIQAFKYIPAKTVEFEHSEPTINIDIEKTPSDEEELEQEDISEKKELMPIETKKTKDAIVKFENLENESISEDSEKENDKDRLSPYGIGLQNAKKFLLEKELDSALKEYTKAIDLASNSEERALCYEEIAKIYAAKNDYLSAHTYAQLAFNEKPNSNREILLARIYYKTGQKDKATVRINNVLNRDFSQEY